MQGSQPDWNGEFGPQSTLERIAPSAILRLQRLSAALPLTAFGLTTPHGIFRWKMFSNQFHNFSNALKQARSNISEQKYNVGF